MLKSIHAVRWLSYNEANLALHRHRALPAVKADGKELHDAIRHSKSVIRAIYLKTTWNGHNTESSDGEPTTLSAAEVIQISKVSRGTTATGPTSISGKLRQKQVARGVRNKDLYEKLNKSMEEYAKEIPVIHPMLHMRRAIHGATKEKPRPHRERKYTFVDTSLYKGYGRSAGEPAAGTSRSSLPFVEPSNQ
ncbi:hypothetical protein Bbelb_283670 [Branchiostoma belcheri]|nr:hypothetical protein Bbelb_283670 [Branchiostoma belcheri]